MKHAIKRALISVSDKTGVESFARMLAEAGVEILATGGTKKLLAGAGIAVREVADVTDFPEMMDGRIKTLHPRIHGGILALREEPSHTAAMDEHGIPPIDLVCVNLYPFEQTIARPDVERAEAIENIDIGGPTMVRSAAKNHRYVAVVTDPDDYGPILDELQRNGGALELATRRRLAVKAFSLTARYDAAISGWLFRSERADGLTDDAHPETFAVAGTKAMDLRYGENPHQTAAFYRTGDAGEASVARADFLGGKELSYNNLVDLDSAHALAKEFAEPFVCVVKHNNPCGAALANSIEQALAQAWEGDPLSAFGSVLAFTRPLNLACAEFLAGGNRFVEAIVAPGFDADALELLRTKPKWGKNVRLLACGPFGPQTRAEGAIEMKMLCGGFLVQGRDDVAETSSDLRAVTKSAPTDDEVAGLLFANRVGKHVKSNAIVIAKGTRVLGVGAGQMSRVDSVRLAVAKAGDECAGSVLASDAFFPFPDGVEVAMEAGVRAIVQPGGSIRDDKVIEACDGKNVAMAFTGKRHFRH